MNILDMKPHPLCVGMPKQKPHESRALLKSIETQGFDRNEPVVIWLDPKIGEDRILDGRHRRDLAKQAGVLDIPWVRFTGDILAATEFATYRRLGRWGGDKGSRASMVASNRKVLGLGLEEAAELAGVSVSQMEKASAVNHKSRKHSAKVMRGELSLNEAVNQIQRTHPESVEDGEDPWIEIMKTRDRFTALESELIEWSHKFDQACDRRGGEMMKLNLRSRMKIVNGVKVPGFTMIEEVLTTIKKNKPKDKCPTCKGSGCTECNSRRYITAHEESAMRNAERSGK